MTETLERQGIQAPVRVLAVLEERIAKVAKVARRLGVPEPEVQVLRRWEAEVTNDWGGKRIEEWVEILLVGETPKLEGGWEVVAAVEHTAVGNIVRQAPKFQDEELGLHESDARCDHCGTIRSRKLTVLLQAEDGSRKRVGSSCLKDFLGYALPSVWEVWASLDDIRSGLEEEESGGFRTALPLADHVVLVAAAFTLRDGFAGSGSDFPTKIKVSHALFPKRPEDSIKVTDEAVELAKAALAWLEETPADTDYQRNLKVAVRLGEVDYKRMGLVVSLPFAYLKAQDQIAVRERVEEVQVSEVQVGKQRITGQVLTVYWKDTEFGSRQVMTVLDSRGFKVWGSVPKALTNVSVGATVAFEADIQKGDTEGFGFFKRPAKAEVIAA